MMFSVIIPTYNREKELTDCLNSILLQDRLPKELILIDDGELSLSFLKTWTKKAKQHHVSFLYHKKDLKISSRGSSQSRNLGISKVSTEIVVILDDDLILFPNFFLSLLTSWKQNTEEHLLGIGGVIQNSRKISFFEKIFHHFFGLSSSCVWNVNEVGYQSWDDSITKMTTGFYAHGGVCAYQTKALQSLGGFTEFCEGRNALEDVDFFLRAKQAGWHVLLDPSAKVIHAQTKTSRDSDFLTGKKEMTNRIALFKLHIQQIKQKKIWFFWCTTGWILRQLFTCHFSYACGLLFGLKQKRKL